MNSTMVDKFWSFCVCHCNESALCKEVAFVLKRIDVLSRVGTLVLLLLWLHLVANLFDRADHICLRAVICCFTQRLMCFGSLLILSQRRNFHVKRSARTLGETTVDFEASLLQIEVRDQGFEPWIPRGKSKVLKQLGNHRLSEKNQFSDTH